MMRVWPTAGFTTSWVTTGLAGRTSAHADSCGRAMWALGYATRFAPRECLAARRRAAARRARCPASTGSNTRVRKRMRCSASRTRSHAEATPARTRALAAARADRSQRATHASVDADWEWCEAMMTYDNARLLEAVLRAALALGDPRLLRHRQEHAAVLRGARSLKTASSCRSETTDGIRRGGARARFAPTTPRSERHGRPGACGF